MTTNREPRIEHRGFPGPSSIKARFVGSGKEDLWVEAIAAGRVPGSALVQVVRLPGGELVAASVCRLIDGRVRLLLKPSRPLLSGFYRVRVTSGTEGRPSGRSGGLRVATGAAKVAGRSPEATELVVRRGTVERIRSSVAEEARQIEHHLEALARGGGYDALERELLSRRGISVLETTWRSLAAAARRLRGRPPGDRRRVLAALRAALGAERRGIEELLGR